MDLRELEQYRLEDAVKFHDHLNPRIWGDDEQMLPEVRQRLLEIADDFRESLGVSIAVEDITISGSNAAYTYTPHSDIDLHLIVRLPESTHSEVYRELFDAKKYQYNDQNDFRIGGYDVELYVQDADQPHYSQGIYSIMHDRWVSVPRRRKPEIDDMSVRSKYEDMGARVDQAIESGDLKHMDALARKIKTMRQSGLETTGEFGAENLAFKVLRNNGTLQKLRQARQAARDQAMSLSERKRKKRARRRWGVFGGYYYPGYGYGSSEDSGGDAGGGGESRMEDYDPNQQPPGPETKPEMPSGTVLVNVSDVYDWYKLGQDISDLSRANPDAYGKGAPQTVLSFGSEPIEHMYKKNLDRLGMTTLDIDRNAKHKDPEGAYRMDEDQSTESMLKKFVAFAARQLGIQTLPRMQFQRDPKWSKRNNTFGRYRPENNTLTVSLVDRHPLDIMRTIAHELTHHWQNEQQPMPSNAGQTGSRHENQANARAGVIMRKWSDLHPDLFQSQIQESLRGQLGAVAAAACVAGTPGCATTGMTTSDAASAVQTVGRAAQATRPYGTASRADVLRAAAQEELGRVIKDWIRHSPYPLRTDGQEIQRESNSLVSDDFSGQYDTVDLAFSPEYDAAIQSFVEKYKYERFWFVSPKPAVKYDIAYLSIAKTEQLLQVRRFGTISHYDDHRAQSVIVTVPVEKEKAFLTAMNSLSIPVQKHQEVRESSGYIPRRKQRNDPRFRMALTHDVQPGETGRQANKLALKTDSQGHPQLLMKHLTNMLESIKQQDQIQDTDNLFELKMSPGELRKWAKTSQISGMQMGFEAEMIYRDVLTDEDADEPDPRARSIDDVVRFFETGDNHARTLRSLDRYLTTRYNDWRQENLDRDWELMGLSSETREQFDKENGEDYTEEAWLADEFPYMSSILFDYRDLTWPSTKGPNTRSPEDLAQALENVVGERVIASRDYHSAPRRPGQWILEPDSSIKPRDPGDTGLELVSPPMPLATALEKLDQVINWANGSGNAYTNASTGLHLNISMPQQGPNTVDYVKLVLFMGDRYVLEQFQRLGNTYCHSAFDRLIKANKTWSGAKPGFGGTTLKKQQNKIAQAMDLMRRNLIHLAREIVQNNVGENKYTSVHMKDGYVEFRSPGNDYLDQAQQDPGILENTLLRLARALHLASNPDLERREYAKKLYKLLSGYQETEISRGKDDPRYRTRVTTAADFNNITELFARYSAGEMNSDHLKLIWADMVGRESGAEADADAPTGDAEQPNQPPTKVPPPLRQAQWRKQHLSKKIQAKGTDRAHSGSWDPYRKAGSDQWAIQDGNDLRFHTFDLPAGSGQDQAWAYAREWLAARSGVYPEQTIRVVPVLDQTL